MSRSMKIDRSSESIQKPVGISSKSVDKTVEKTKKVIQGTIEGLKGSVKKQFKSLNREVQASISFLVSGKGSEAELQKVIEGLPEEHLPQVLDILGKVKPKPKVLEKKHLVTIERLGSIQARVAKRMKPEAFDKLMKELVKKDPLEAFAIGGIPKEDKGKKELVMALLGKTKKNVNDLCSVYAQLLTATIQDKKIQGEVLEKMKEKGITPEMLAKKKEQLAEVKEKRMSRKKS